MAVQRMHRGLVAGSASAIAAIYLVGYLHTQSADASIGAATVPESTPASAIVATAPTATPSLQPTPLPLTQPLPGSRGRTPPAPAPTPTPATQTQAPASYRDGTYTGQGTSRRGDVWVSVQVSGGRISSVNITRSTLQYPLRDIASLPSEVVQRQSAQVDIVSRATYSSTAFRQAISQALASAQA